MFVSAPQVQGKRPCKQDTKPDIDRRQDTPPDTVTATPVGKQLSGLVSRFAENTTMHGFAGLCSKRVIFNRFKWKNYMFLVAILACMSVLGLNLYFLFKEYFEYPVTTSILRERRQSMDLPAITFCADSRVS